MRDKAISLIKRIQDAGKPAYLVGGCVRDDIMKLVPHDYDIVTGMLPEEIEATFCDLKTIPVGKSFGVITVVVDGDHFQIATFRADGAYSDARHPDDVKFVTTIEEDLARRDFTMNAIAYDPIADQYIDPHGGRADIRRKQINFVGKPFARINEDPLRILRAVKFEARLLFDAPTWRDSYEDRYELKDFAYRLNDVPRERITQEFQEILTHEMGLDLLKQHDMLEYVIPGIECTWGLAGIQDSKYHQEGSVWEHTHRVVKILREHGADFKLLLAGLLHDIGKPATAQCSGNGRVSCQQHAEVGSRMAKNICNYWLKLPRETTNYVCDLVAYHMQAHEFNKLPDSDLKTWLAWPHIKDLVLLQHADSTGRDSTEPKGSNLEFMTAKIAELEALPAHMRPDAKSIIGGDDLIAYGLTPNPQFKHLLDVLRKEQLAGAFDESTAKSYMANRLNGMALRTQNAT